MSGEDTDEAAHDYHLQYEYAEVRLQVLVSRGVTDKRSRHLHKIRFRLDIFAPQISW